MEENLWGLISGMYKKQQPQKQDKKTTKKHLENKQPNFKN